MALMNQQLNPDLEMFSVPAPATFLETSWSKSSPSAAPSGARPTIVDKLREKFAADQVFIYIRGQV